MKLNSFTERFARLVYERRKSDVVHFSEISRDIQPCLVFMPARLDTMRPAAEILPEIASAFPNRSLKIILTSSVDPQSHEFIKKFVVIRAESGDLDTFSLPKKHFIEKVAYGGAGVSIDLDIKPNLFNAVLGMKSGAAIRTAFDKGVGLPYYNLIIGSPEPGAAQRDMYRIMADILSNFRS
jgi:hypothetical protein